MRLSRLTPWKFYLLALCLMAQGLLPFLHTPNLQLGLQASAAGLGETTTLDVQWEVWRAQGRDLSDLCFFPGFSLPATSTTDDPPSSSARCVVCILLNAQVLLPPDANVLFAEDRWQEIPTAVAAAWHPSRDWQTPPARGPPLTTGL
jgi:hypothetical protein